MATLIGLSVRVRLLRALPRRFKVHPGTLTMPVSRGRGMKVLTTMVELVQLSYNERWVLSISVI